MAKKKNGVRLLLLALSLLCALVLWFFWRDVAGLIRPVAKKIVPQLTEKSSQEKIMEEDRKKLEEILKRR